jgi:hypothetical protein
MLGTFPRLTVFEGYAGPGVYTKGEDGSPVIAIRGLIERAADACARIFVRPGRN